MEHSDYVRSLQEEIEFLKADNKQLREAGEKLCDELQHAGALGYQIWAAAGRFWSDVLHWKFVVLILAVEAIRLGIDISRLGH